MTRRIRHELIADENTRNTTFGKRGDGLLKKANELSILCGVDIGIVVHNQEREDNAILWPSPEIFNERLQRFLDFPDGARTRQMITHRIYMEQTLDAEMEKLSNSKNITQLKESHQLMNGLTRDNKDLNDLDLYQLTNLETLADDMLRKLEKRENDLNNEQ